MAKNSLKAGAFVSYAYTFAHIAVQLIYVPILLNYIGQAEYGLYQLVGSIMSYIVSINGVLSAGVGRYYCMYRAEGDEARAENSLAIARRIYYILTVVTAFAIALLIPAMNSVYSSSLTPDQLEELSLMLVVLGLNCIVTMNNTVSIAVISAYERFIFLKGSQLIAVIAQPLMVVALVSVVPNALMVTLVVLFMNASCAIVQRMYARKVLGVQWRYRGFDKCLIKGIVGFSASILLVTVADQIFWKTDQLIIGYFMGADSVAIYAVGAQIYSAYMCIGIAVSSVFLPRISNLYHGACDMGAISSLFAKVGRLSTIVCLFVLGGFAVLGRDFMVLWAGEGFEDSYWIAIVIMIPFTIDIIQNTGLTILQVMDRYLFRGVMYLAMALLNVPLTIVLLREVGLLGAAISTAIAMFIGSGIIMNVYYSQAAKLDIRQFWREVGKVAAPLLLAVALFALLANALHLAIHQWSGFILAGLLYVALFCVFLWAFGLDDYEKDLLRSFAIKLKG